MEAIVRQALREDVSAMHRVRAAVRENRLVSIVIPEEATIEAIEVTGKGWVVEITGEVVGFAIANRTNGNIWALFIDPAHEKKGYGKRLLDEMVAWMKAEGLNKIWLSTDPGTRAEGFYESAGWTKTGMLENGEVRFEMILE